MTMMKKLKALAETIDNSTEEGVINMYELIDSGFNTAAEREAFRLGALALMAGVGNMRLRHWYYTRKFKRAFNKLAKE